MAKKSDICKKVYILADGTESRTAHPDATKLQFRFSNGEVESIAMGDCPDQIERRLNWFGRSEKLGNFYAKSDGDPAVAHGKFVTGMEMLAGGEWAERVEGEARPSMVVAAIVAALVEAGETVDDDREAAIREKTKGPEGRKAALANVVFNAHYERIKLEHAKERADAAKKAAKGADILDDLAAY